MTRRVSSAPHDDMSLRAKNETMITWNGERSWAALQTTPHGFVWMEAENDVNGGGQMLRLWFVWQGREYVRIYERFYGPTWAARLAAAFAREVAEGKVQP